MSSAWPAVLGGARGVPRNTILHTSAPVVYNNGAACSTRISALVPSRVIILPAMSAVASREGPYNARSDNIAESTLATIS